MASADLLWNRQALRAMLVRRALDGSAPVTAATIATWRRVAEALAPVIGDMGVMALFERSLHLTCAEFPWLSTVQRAPQIESSLKNLRQCLADRERTDSSAVTAASSAHLYVFAERLAVLIGPSLSGRLLRPVWSPPTGSASEEVSS